MDLAAVVLAAGAGTRLWPLSDLLPKALCPVGNIPLVDRALGRAAEVTSACAVNVWHQGDKVIAHLDDRVHISVEGPEPLGTAGALGQLKDWISERPVLVQNADAFHEVDTDWFLDDWDGERPRLLMIDEGRPSDFGTLRFCGMSALPWKDVERLKAEPSGLYEVLWGRQWDMGGIDVRQFPGPFVDCGTPRDYWEANMILSGGTNVIGAGAIVEGTVDRCVLWPGVHVGEGEALLDAIRASDDITVDVGGRTTR